MFPVKHHLIGADGGERYGLGGPGGIAHASAGRTEDEPGGAGGAEQLPP
jgi:hypothetical protein